MKYFVRFILKITGWKYIKPTEKIDKSVICVAPHTSNWDFIMGQFFASACKIKSSFLMKKEWFVFPLKGLFKAMGGIPIDRSKKTSVTDQVAETFKQYKEFHIAIAPEGTRGYVKEWKKGFYYIALKANVPIQLAYIDYTKKEMGITKVFYPTGNEDTDLKEIKAFYATIKGKFPERFHVHK